MSATLSSTPRQDGFRMPGEFEPHAGTWMLWPERPDNWRLGAKPAQKTFAQVAAAIAQFEPLTIGVSNAQYLNARSLLPPTVRVVELSYDDSWMRDCGPTFVKNDQGLVRVVDWEFNAWGGLTGGLYFPWDNDNKVARKVAELERVDRYKAPLVLEGGSIHVDGQGTLLTTEECLLNPNRNPELSKGEIESYLQDYLNIQKIIWLGQGIFNDETNGHVDNIACFVRPGVIALAWTDDKQDPQYEISADAYERLRRTTDARGRALEVHKIHVPNPIFITEEESQGVDSAEGTLPRNPGDRLAGSYVNYYCCNGAVIVPTFNDPHDALALQELQVLYPDRTIVPIPAREILLGGGNIHCITQQQPQP
ncbi:agmatine deiminase [Levilinea saccharolytica]|uniref:Putative agmatine deiminase n=1 Tax=Levilinea saccharolytica TaxID=229921 RepID=A0A0P6Y7T8_9CHLR|nr:agmatine deiminase [Levilinea saccharolytica]KPL84952.1 agmatine deiminase [Levilinea saccharolytica]